ncbi:hypothetical protein LCGC14_1849510 [marine sediment metagenome]|uniref:Tyrosine specific protein phosphatases domain-containing protein n=1 Tax=marine sediment metagenome TaxID=412755 RepID=A0A0F9IQB6_9ZZZZ
MVTTLSDKVQRLAEEADKVANTKQIRLCSACAQPLNGSLFYCKVDECTSFPLCDECLCHTCGCCPDCEECGVPDVGTTSNKGRLFCASCGQVETFQILESTNRFKQEVTCTVCGHDYSMNTEIENLYMEGVDYDFQRRVNGEQSGKEETKQDDYLYLFCSGCFKNTQHKEKYIAISGGVRTEHFQCLICQKDRVGKTRRNADGSYEYLDSEPRASLASTYHQKGTGDDAYGFGGWSYCDHWRDPVRVGEWKVYVSASSDRPTPTERAAKKENEQPILPDYGLYFATDRTGYGVGWGAKVQTTPDFPTNELGLVTAYPRLFYDWVDMGAPRGPIVIKLVAWAVEKIKSGVKLDLGCFGGHGRTGTFLALLLMEIEGLTAAEAMKEVWTRHCEQAIETYVQKKFIYEFNGEKAPPPPVSTYTSNFKSGVTGKKAEGNKFKYLSRKEKKKLKASRRRVRRELKDCVVSAVEAGVTSRKVLEADGKIWSCGKCGKIKRSTGTLGEGRDAKWFIWCQGCTQAVQHVRPEVLFDLLGE